jgi:hypothetical protein
VTRRPRPAVRVGPPASLDSRSERPRPEPAAGLAAAFTVEASLRLVTVSSTLRLSASGPNSRRIRGCSFRVKSRRSGRDRVTVDVTVTGHHPMMMESESESLLS